MQLLKWSSQFELGLELVDNQHKQLFNMINELSIAIEYNQPNTLMLPIVDRLKEYANNHFKAEEDIFIEYDYPDREGHEADHDKFIESVKYIRRQCELLDSLMSAKIREFLMGWLANHIMTKDTPFYISDYKDRT